MKYRQLLTLHYLCTGMKLVTYNRRFLCLGTRRHCVKIFRCCMDSCKPTLKEVYTAQINTLCHVAMGSKKGCVLEAIK